MKIESTDDQELGSLGVGSRAGEEVGIGRDGAKALGRGESDGSSNDSLRSEAGTEKRTGKKEEETKKGSALSRSSQLTTRLFQDSPSSPLVPSSTRDDASSAGGGSSRVKSVDESGSRV